jgi:hypothetical protein
MFTMTQGQGYQIALFPPKPNKQGFAVAEVRECVETGWFIYIMFIYIIKMFTTRSDTNDY